jgi:SAM-dependent methyltransferase
MTVARKVLAQTKGALRRLGLTPGWFDEARLLVQLPAFQQLLRDHPFHGRCLNAGCGEGLFAPLLESFPEVTRIVNVDVHPPALTRSRQDPRHEDHQGSLTSLPFADASFDCCLCSEVLEHIPDDGRAVRELARVLKPGALLLVSVPSPPAPPDQAHVREGYTRDALRALLSANGFTPLADTVCMHAVSRALYQAWHWQYELTGRNLFPRPLMRALGHADRRLPLGSPWDLVMLARRDVAPTG